MEHHVLSQLRGEFVPRVLHTSETLPDGVTGQFFNKTHTARAHRQAYDHNARAELWHRSLQLTGEPDIATDPGRPG